MDATYKESLIEKIAGNPFYRVNFKEGLIDIIQKYISQSQSKLLVRMDKGRFFYESSTDEVDKNILNALSSGAKRQIQSQYNQDAAAIARPIIQQLSDEGASLNQIINEVNNALRGEEIGDNEWVDNNFEYTYRRGGHLYIGGVRMY